VQRHQRRLGLVVVHRLAGQPGQRPELQQQGADLGGVALPAAGLAGAEVDVHVGHPGGRAEGGQEAPPQLVGQGQEARVARQLMGREQAAQDADGDLEVLHRDVVIEGQLLDDEGQGLVGLGAQPRQQEGVQAVHRGHQQGDGVPVVRGPAHRAQLVVTPGVAAVALPGVEDLPLHRRGHLGVAGGGPARRRGATGAGGREGQGHDDGPEQPRAEGV
jgi:hypothetical protein